jgi:DNA-binding MarR family transcriptional regulator
MKLFTGLKKIRELEKLQLPFLKSVIDLDILIEIGYEEEHGRPLTLKRLYLLDVCSRGTIRRKLANLIDQGIVIRRKQASDRRASLLVVSPGTLKLLGKYCGGVSAISAAHFK